MGRKLTQEEFVQKVYEKYGNEYTVLGEYVHSQKEILIRHNICGKEFFATGNAFLHDKAKCPCLKKTLCLVGQRFGRLTVLEEVPERRKNGTVMWKCLCDCGTIKNVSSGNLTSGHTTSCGCYASEKKKETRVDLTGKKFGLLTVLKRDDNYISPSGHQNTKWLCQCECGNIVSICRTGLTSGEAKSCGCLKSKLTSERCLKDLTGETFGNLTVIKIHNKRQIHKNARPSVLWECQCSCGNYTIVSGSNLKTGHVQSCGCVNSKNEKSIGEILRSIQNITFKPQYRFKDCKDKKSLPFDFGIFYNKSLLCCIEYDGEGHFKPIPRGDMDITQAELELKKIQYHDLIKTKYCKSHNIPLLRISYLEKDKLEELIFDFINNLINNKVS